MLLILDAVFESVAFAFNNDSFTVMNDSVKDGGGHGVVVGESSELLP